MSELPKFAGHACSAGAVRAVAKGFAGVRSRMSRRVTGGGCLASSRRSGTSCACGCADADLVRSSRRGPDRLTRPTTTTRCRSAGWPRSGRRHDFL